MKSIVIAVFVLAVVSATLAESVPFPEECAKICPLNYAPVCVEEEGQLLNFGNDCALEVYNCEHKKNLLIKMREECPQ